ncbi:sensor histidine kinase [Sphingomonas cavernae]|uniref:histidine kinase n=1 Tax=Sphingomonas cavernae TaxID=2320861 RepID=A0A418WPM1_9SPHN|nr:PAS domain-containing sensor histidine kinase [Sphingomonas cavernae]RJF93181.1 histidine kinase [Sphingomonas cavernae]
MDIRTPVHPEAANSLMLAVIASSNAPILLLDGDLTVIAASTSFLRAFQIEPASVPGRPLAGLGAGEWDVPQLGSLLRATVSGHAEIDAYEMDLRRAGQEVRHLVLSAQKLDYFDADTVRLLLTISDVTDARLREKLKDDLLREKAILLQELQHRVANSLQIIASVLMQSARRVKSEETRGHLHDAHNRVMSVAAVQRQLATSRLGDVHLRAYFTELCESIGASMIRDHNQLSLEVSADESVTGADVSVSLGLVVTELVINALKHAFPGHRHGKISVDYQSCGAEWTLSVSDDGIGMPVDPGSGRPGLGTSIVEAIAKQLDARVRIADANPGTAVSIVHARAPREFDARNAA